LYKEQCGYMLDAMDQHFPDTVTWTRPEGGMFIWVTLPAHMDGSKLLARAIEQNVAFVPGEPFYAGPNPMANTLRLSFVTVSEEKLREGIAILGKLIREGWLGGPQLPEKAPGTPDLADMRPDDWVARWLPASWGPYARLCRLDRPVGTWLTLLPCLAALVQAADGWPTLLRLFIFSLGALLMRGIGCCFNDIFDRDIDQKVERTRFRPLTSGQLSLKNALWFVLAQLAVCALLLLALNEYSRWLAVALVPIVI